MWSLINVNDSKSLTMYEMERGVAAVTRSEEFFDCLPAVRSAFNFAKVFSNKGVDEEEERKKKEELEGSSNVDDVNDPEVIKVPAKKVEKITQ